MKSPAQNRKNETEPGKITMEDIRAHLQRFGKDIPCLPLASRVEEKGEEPEDAPAREIKEPPKSSGSGMAPLDTRGLSQALIDRPGDVNSPY